MLVLLIALSGFHGHASAMTDLTAKCSKYGKPLPKKNLSFQLTNCLLTYAAIEKDVPPEVVKAVASQENGWKQFKPNGEAITSLDGGIGLMQITNQEDYDEESLKSDIVSNIEAGVAILSSMYDRMAASELPKIKGAGRHDIENWYFPVMAYNGIKPVNSPFRQKDGTKNTDAYQEKVFANIEKDSFLGETKLARFPFKRADFDYDRQSDGNIQFVTKEYALTEPLHPSNYFFKKGSRVVVTHDTAIRPKPSTDFPPVKKGVVKNTPLITNNDLAFDQTANKLNQFAWYQVKMKDNTIGYVTTAYIGTPTFCSQFSKNQVIKWKGVPLRRGQIGRLTVLKNTPLFKLNGTTPLPAVRTLEKGKIYQIYAFKKDYVSVGGGYFVARDNKVKYETPSKFNLMAVKCIAENR